MRILLLQCILCFGHLSLNAEFNPDSALKRSGNKAPLFLYTVGYRSPVTMSKIIRSGHGVYMEAGVNMAKLFSKKGVVGLFAGWGMMDRLWNSSFTTGFIRDYQNAINTERTLPANEFQIIHSSSDLIASQKGRAPAIPGCSTNSFHDYSLYYGLIFKLPDIPAFVKLYTGSTRSHYQEIKSSAEGPYYILQFRRALYGCEFLVSGFIKSRCPIFKRLGCSLYYEYCNFRTATLYADRGGTTTSIPLRIYTNSNFLNKYRHEQLLGVKVCLSFM